MGVNGTSTHTHRRAATGWVIALTGIGSLMAALDTLVVSTALSTIRIDLGASVQELEWTVNAYNLAFAVSLIAAAALGDRYGRRRLYAAGLVLLALASAACALAPNVGWLIGARAVQGLGAALLLTLGLALLSAAFPPERRGAAARPIGTFKPKIHSQSIPSTTAPPTSGPAATAIPVTALKIPIAAPRRSGGNAALNSANPSVSRSAAPSPCTARAPISQPTFGARAQAAEASANSTRPAAYSRRLP